MAEIKIRGISGWILELAKSDSKIPTDQTDADAFALGEADLDTPEKRLAAFKKAVEEGRVEIASEERGGFTIQWAKDGVGFGELTIVMNEDGSISIDDECSSRKFLQEILLAVLEQGQTVSEMAGRSDPPVGA